ncbi:uncharacterized protein LOC121969305 [Zingiber officinale]|uniref:Uncharacterized protein n=1 Tax=Zingiber officinale TaxID=94328 RepID=A0A8J5H123_ZINOF|nr:uncharacterized protein LOC121969305 [Zingiber officinale]KAG6513239.1 hypothetical protein ZIOFF_023552 [Zingiber officinale]
MAPKNQGSQRGRTQRLVLCLLAICASGTADNDVRPSEHGLANQKDPGPASPAMIAFFRARPEEEALPEAQNVTWKVTPPGPQERRHPRTGLLAAGLAFGAVGAAILAVAAAAAAYAAHARRCGSGSGPAWAMGSARRRSGPEVRLGTP